jgi:hypothetical protein
VERDGVRGEEGARLVLVAFFEVAKARVEDFFHAAEFGAPQIAHIVEAAVDGVEAGIDVGSKKRHDETEHCGVEQHRDADGEIQLFVGHTVSALCLALFSHERECAMIEDPCH